MNCALLYWETVAAQALTVVTSWAMRGQIKVAAASWAAGSTAAVASLL